MKSAVGNQKRNSFGTLLRQLIGDHTKNLPDVFEVRIKRKTVRFLKQPFGFVGLVYSEKGYAYDRGNLVINLKGDDCRISPPFVTHALSKEGSMYSKGEYNREAVLGVINTILSAIAELRGNGIVDSEVSLPLPAGVKVEGGQLNVDHVTQAALPSWLVPFCGCTARNVKVDPVAFVKGTFPPAARIAVDYGDWDTESEIIFSEQNASSALVAFAKSYGVKVSRAPRKSRT